MYVIAGPHASYFMTFTDVYSHNNLRALWFVDIALLYAYALIIGVMMLLGLFIVLRLESFSSCYLQNKRVMSSICCAYISLSFIIAVIVIIIVILLSVWLLQALSLFYAWCVDVDLNVLAPSLIDLPL